MHKQLRTQLAHLNRTRAGKVTCSCPPTVSREISIVAGTSSTPQSPFVENWGTFRLPVSGLGFAAIARSSRTDKVGKEIA